MLLLRHNLTEIRHQYYNLHEFFYLERQLSNDESKLSLALLINFSCSKFIE
jgi:hypothetical protein